MRDTGRGTEIDIMRLSALLVVAIGLAAGGSARGDDGPKPEKKANRLANETSPYLLQHAHNPVNWYPWGPEAFDRAKKDGKPVFLSVGYSSCYWCHVMERESFEDEAIARYLNERFICIKVDREERPDVDSVYMAALQAYTGGGGWPMSIFLFPDGRPFYAATYLPPRSIAEREGFEGLLVRIHDAWRDHRGELSKDADSLAKGVRDSVKNATERKRVALSRRMLDAGQGALAEQFDPDFGGFGFDPETPKKPKFPEPSNLFFLLDRDRRPIAETGRLGLLKGPDPRTMLVVTFDHMARGGIRDHLAGGYHRYSVNRGWTIPHFEKMLYDNAQLASVFWLMFEATKDGRWRTEAEEIFRFVDRSMTAPEGAFFSALDAETDGDEGGYYVWKPEEVEAVLGKGEDFSIFSKTYGLDRGPNFDGGRFVLRESLPRAAIAEGLGLTVEALEARLVPLRAKLLAAREMRPRPRLDDKILTSWNGLMIAAYAEGYRVTKEEKYREKAEKAADFLLKMHRDPAGRLLRTSRNRQAKGAGYLEDYAMLAHGLLRLHAATGDANRLAQARELTDRMVAEFSDPAGGFFFTADGHESLIARMKDPFDNALPGANSVAIRNLVALGVLTREKKYLDLARKSLEAFSAVLSELPAASPLMLLGLREYLDASTSGGPTLGGAPAPAPEAPALVTAEAALAPDAKPLAGGEFEVRITLSIQDGWHIAANPSKSEVVRATTVELPPDSPLEIVKIAYPEGKILRSPGGADETMATYEGKVVFSVRVQAGAKFEGATPLEFLVRYQPCNDRVCLPPVRLKVELKAGPLSKGS